MIAERELMKSGPALVELRNLSKVFKTPKGDLKAFTDISLKIDKGVSLGVVGESGSGKSTLIRTMQLLERPTTGTVRMSGIDVTNLSDRKLKSFRQEIQFVAQDPFGSLFPNLTIAQNIMVPMQIHHVGDKKAHQERVLELMSRVGLPAATYHAFPHELSGGQQQRVAIARALSLSPQILVLDEAVSSLDVSIQAQILNLLQRLKDELGLTYVFISHNLAVVRLMCEVTTVMYLGRVVEQGESNQMFQRPVHPYTRSLIASIPAFSSKGVTPLPDDSVLMGEPPSPTNVPSGCAYHARCPFATEECKVNRPELREVSPGRAVACHHAESLIEGVS